MKKILIFFILVFSTITGFSQTYTIYTSKVLKSNGGNLKCDDNPGYIRFIGHGKDSYIVEFRTKLIEQDMLFYDQGNGHFATLEKQNDGSVIRYDIVITEVENIPAIYVKVFNMEYLFRIEHVD